MFGNQLLNTNKTFVFSWYLFGVILFQIFLYRVGLAMIHWFQTLLYRVGLDNFGVIHWFQTFNQLLNTNKNLIHWISHDQSWYLSDGVNITHAEAIWILGTLFIEFHEGRFFTKEDLPCTRTSNYKKQYKED